MEPINGGPFLTPLNACVSMVHDAIQSFRFDDDQYPLRSAKAWWRNPDGAIDDHTELTTRKTVISC